MTDTGPDDDTGDSSAYAHLPSGQRLYHLLLAMTEEQVIRAQLAFYPDGTEEYPVLAELWTDIDELAEVMLDEDPTDPVATDYRKRWAQYDAVYGAPWGRDWQLTVLESRERARLIKRFMLRAGPLSLRRREGDSTRDYWTPEALEYE